LQDIDSKDAPKIFMKMTPLVEKSASALSINKTFFGRFFFALSRIVNSYFAKKTFLIFHHQSTIVSTIVLSKWSVEIVEK
jgi:hypothetical protein